MSLTKKVYLTISGYDIKLSDNLTFYQKDQLKLIFYINEYGIDYENNATTRALMPVNPLNAILFIENPDGVDSVSSARIEDNAVTFYLDSTHTQYVGISRMQLRLFDQDGCAITLPHFTFEIRENIYGSGDVRFQNVVMVDQTGTVILTEDNDLLDVGDILTMGTEVAYPQVTKTIKELPIKNNLDGTEKLIVEDDEATKQAPLGTIVDEIKQNSQEKIREIESGLAQTNAQLSATTNEYGLLNLPPESDITDVLKSILETNVTNDKKSVVLLPNSICYISDTISIKKDNVHIKGGANTEIRKKADVEFFKLYAQKTLISSVLFRGNNDKAYDSFEDTTSGIILGRNNGDNTWGPQTIYSNDCMLENVRIERCGNHGFDWQEGRGLRLDRFISAYNTNDGIYVTDKALDANHGTFTFAEMMRNGRNGITNVNCSNFTNLKLFENKKNGCILGGGCVGTIFSENNGMDGNGTPGVNGLGIIFNGVCNNINVQWLNDKWDDRGGEMEGVSRNYISGISLPTDDRSIGQRLTKTNQLLVGKGFKEHESSGFQNWISLLTKPTDMNEITESVLGTSGDSKKIIDKGTASKLEYIFATGTVVRFGNGTPIKKINAVNASISATVQPGAMTQVSVGRGEIKFGVGLKAFISGEVPKEIIIQESIPYDGWVYLRLYNMSDKEVNVYNLPVTIIMAEFDI